MKFDDPKQTIKALRNIVSPSTKIKFKRIPKRKKSIVREVQSLGTTMLKNANNQVNLIDDSGYI